MTSRFQQKNGTKILKLSPHIRFPTMPNPYASIFQGCFRITMSLKPAPLQFHTHPYHNPPIKFRPLLFTPVRTHVSPGGSLHLRSVVACSASSGACSRSLERDWRQRNVALLYLFHQNSRYGVLAYDDFSELDFDREVESAQQPKMRLIFDKPEDGVRKIVLSTNMAETSITMNDVVFVVDGGKAKETSYDALNNTPCLLPSWISKAAARQVQNAIEYLKTIGAFDENENLTVLGRYLSMLPVEPKLGKMLIFGAIFNCLNPIMTFVAGLSVRDLFLMPADKRDLLNPTLDMHPNNELLTAVRLLVSDDDYRGRFFFSSQPPNYSDKKGIKETSPPPRVVCKLYLAGLNIHHLSLQYNRSTWKINLQKRMHLPKLYNL